MLFIICVISSNNGQHCIRRNVTNTIMVGLPCSDISFFLLLDIEVNLVAVIECISTDWHNIYLLHNFAFIA